MSYRGAKVGHAFSSVEQVRLGRVALLQQPLWPHGQGVGPPIRRLRARVPQGVLGESKLCKSLCIKHMPAQLSPA